MLLFPHRSVTNKCRSLITAALWFSGRLAKNEYDNAKLEILAGDRDTAAAAAAAAGGYHYY